MMMFTLLMLMLIMMFPLMKHPLSMGFLLILLTLMIAFITGIIKNNMFMLSYILFITMMSGALELFIYMASVAYNEKFKTSSSLTVTMLMKTVFIIVILYLNDEVLMNKIMMMDFNLFNDHNQSLMMIKLFNKQAMMITMLLVLYLLLTMITISFISFSKYCQKNVKSQIHELSGSIEVYTSLSD